MPPAARDEPAARISRGATPGTPPRPRRRRLAALLAIAGVWAVAALFDALLILSTATTEWGEHIPFARRLRNLGLAQLGPFVWLERRPATAFPAGALWLAVVLLCVVYPRSCAALLVSGLAVVLWHLYSVGLWSLSIT